MKKRYILFLFLLMLLVAPHTQSQWLNDVRFTNAADTSKTSYNTVHCIAVNGNTIHTVWSDKRNGYFQLYYKRSINNGLTWEIEQKLSNANYSNFENACIAVTGAYVHIVTQLKDINYGNSLYYIRSNDNGVTWYPFTELITDYGKPVIAASGTDVLLVYKGLTYISLHYMRSTNNGITWGPNTVVNNAGQVDYCSAIVRGSSYHLVWEDERDGNKEIYYKRSDNRGASWTIDKRITNNSASSLYPSIAVSDTSSAQISVHLAWQEDRDGNNEIYYVRSLDGGNTWGTNVRLTNTSGSSQFPQIFSSGSKLHLVWQDNTPNNYEIYYSRSLLNGFTWENDTRITNSPGSSVAPHITVSGDAVHVLWSDFRDGNYEIYYKRNPTGNSIGIENISSEVPNSYSLFQNYPNPFNPTTKIKFDIPMFSNVKISIYDITGKELEILVNEKLQAGTYQTAWNASNISSGVYFYRLTADGFTETKKMILMK